MLTSQLLSRFHALSFIQHASPADHLLLYSPLPKEFDPLTLMHAFAGTCYLPRIAVPAKRLMTFHAVTPQSRLTAHPQYGMQEPAPTATKFNPATLGEQDRVIVLVPALATDEYGHRLGYGGGYYDTFLSQLYTTVTQRIITACWMSDERHVPELPHQPTDIPVGWIITPTRIIEANSETTF